VLGELEISLEGHSSYGRLIAPDGGAVVRKKIASTNDGGRMLDLSNNSYWSGKLSFSPSGNRGKMQGEWQLNGKKHAQSVMLEEI
jgi:hypothetical protein